MKTISKKWHRWLAIPLAVVLVVATVLGVQMTRPADTAYASNVNVAVDNTTLTGQDIPGQFTYVQFDISWDYSWRDAINWDAVWVFVKYRVDGGAWEHATLSATGTDHSVTTDNGVVAAIDGVTDGTGVFMYRNVGGDGSIDWDGVKLKWEYGTDGVADDALVEGKVFAIEMVYVKQGSFWLGDADNDQTSGFLISDGSYVENDPDGPYQVTSEGEIIVGTLAGNLYYDTDAGAGGAAGDHGTPIPAAFPKGYAAIYSMKYETSQEQYAEFLNTLTWTQANARYPGNYWVNRQCIQLVGSVYGVDGNQNNIFGEAVDNQGAAANHLSWADAGAYADWAGLRPMTELEFEKIARGTQAVADDEYAWGTTDLVQQTDGADWGLVTEYPTPTNSNANFGNSLPNPQGPMRVGSFTDADDTRVEAGASYYGAMEMSGNLMEIVVSVGNDNGRLFDGAHGDGSLNAAGNHDVASWPLIAASDWGTAMRGGNWADGANAMTIASRHWGVSDPLRWPSTGFRAVRTAP